MKTMVCGEPQRTHDVFCVILLVLDGPFGQQQLVLHFPRAFVVTIAPAHSFDFNFFYAKSVFVLFSLRKDGILYFNILRNNGFRWSPWHVENHTVLLVWKALWISQVLLSMYHQALVGGSPLSMCFRRYHHPYPRSNFTMPSIRRPQVLTPRLYPVTILWTPFYSSVPTSTDRFLSQ